MQRLREIGVEERTAGEDEQLRVGDEGSLQLRNEPAGRSGLPQPGGATPGGPGAGGGDRPQAIGLEVVERIGRR